MTVIAHWLQADKQELLGQTDEAELPVQALQINGVGATCQVCRPVPLGSFHSRPGG
jgi:hypothetical protein